MAQYYAQRASVGLIITEGTSAALNDPDMATFYTPGPRGISIIQC
jgi:2,4-dienoyl-CoA reductase-like NADH-dependent reductase (Old Yellow Enzyme family)